MRRLYGEAFLRSKEIDMCHLFRLSRYLCVLVLGVLVLGLAACDSKIVQNLVEQSDSDVSESSETLGDDGVVENLEIPDLPFPENPDPNECGIPTLWGNADNQAWLTGYYDGELVQPVVYLYNSHARTAILVEAPSGAEVEILMFQANPVLDYYYVKIVGAEAGQNEGWVPEPFLTFEPISG